MTISFEIPLAIEQELCTDADDLSREAKEAFLVELYRQEKISRITSSPRPWAWTATRRTVS